ncbi:uncharacterized protein LOC113752810 [Coffea eugenioides]|uniref:uncharacterized protein LOC113752810 n=1 Tax=Coffea eugenioides TaxID=49369 RepID=UPI000F6113AB|nr:uncharacterized protein LOC113752810 [Coffea eugenioides]
MVARGWLGRLRGARAIPNFSCASPKVEEAKALREAMIVAQQQGWRSVEFEVDCSQVVKAVCSEEEDVVIATIVHDIRILRLKFDECCFTFTNRVNNFVSHKLAKVAITLEQNTEWKENFLVWLLEQVQADCKSYCPPIL